LKTTAGIGQQMLAAFLFQPDGIGKTDSG